MDVLADAIAVQVDAHIVVVLLVIVLVVHLAVKAVVVDANQAVRVVVLMDVNLHATVLQLDQNVVDV